MEAARGLGAPATRATRKETPRGLGSGPLDGGGAAPTTAPRTRGQRASADGHRGVPRAAAAACDPGGGGERARPATGASRPRLEPAAIRALAARRFLREGSPRGRGRDYGRSPSPKTRARRPSTAPRSLHAHRPPRRRRTRPGPRATGAHPHTAVRRPRAPHTHPDFPAPRTRVTAPPKPQPRRTRQPPLPRTRPHARAHPQPAHGAAMGSAGHGWEKAGGVGRVHTRARGREGKRRAVSGGGTERRTGRRRADESDDVRRARPGRAESTAERLHLGGRRAPSPREGEALRGDLQPRGTPGGEPGGRD